LASKDLYQILGVKPTASADEIKRAYRDLAKKYHPDRTGGDKAKESRFKDVTHAYDVLSDESKRAKYDALRAGPRMGAGMPFDLGDLFGGMPGRRGAGGTGGPSIEDLLQQMFGAQNRGGARVVTEEPEPRHARRRPAPQAEEEVIRAPDGTLLIRRGDDLYVDAPITIDEAVLGTRVDVPTLSGRVKVTIPAGTSSSQKLRLRGKGLSPDSGGPAGDQFVVIQIVVPTDIDDRARELIREFAARAPTKPRK
jgi:DnaJ-class molecular chaperone